MVLTSCLSPLVDVFRMIASAPRVIPELLPSFLPYGVVVAGFAAFVVWNGGIVLGEHDSFQCAVTVNETWFLGDKSNHVPSFHVPQLYYFIGFATLLGWPALLSAPGGIQGLARGVWYRMFGCRRYMSFQCGRGMSPEGLTPSQEHCMHMRRFCRYGVYDPPVHVRPRTLRY